MASSNTRKIVTGLGIAGAAAAAIAGGYFLYGKDSAKNKKKLHSWMLKAKAEVMDHLEKAKDLSEENFNMIVDAAAAKYAKAKKIAPEEVDAYAKSLKKHWKDIKRDMSPAPAKKAAHKSARKAAKKSSSK